MELYHYKFYDEDADKKEREKKEKKEAKLRQEKYQDPDDRERILDALGGKKEAFATLESWGRGIRNFIQETRMICIFEEFTPVEYRGIFRSLRRYANDMGKYHCTYMLDADEVEQYIERKQRSQLSQRYNE